MTLSRRNFLGMAVAGAAGALPHSARAEPYVNNTGLGRGQFIWEGWKAPDGPMVVVVSRSAQVAHVYRGGVEIAIAGCTTGRPGFATPTGIFLIRSEDRQRAGRGRGERLTWSGTALHAKGAARFPAAQGLVRVPADFAGLLFDVMGDGAVVVVADERTYPFDVAHNGLLASRRRQEAHAVAPTGEPQPVVVTDAPAGAPMLSVVVSVADRTAYVMRDGVVEAAVPVTVRSPEKRLGTHVYSLVSGGESGAAPRWIAFGLGERPSDANLASWLGTTALERVSLSGRIRALPALETARPGTTLIVTDEAAPSSARMVPLDFVVLAGETAAAVPVGSAPSRTRAASRARAPRRALVESLIASDR